MARKGLLANITGDKLTAVNNDPDAPVAVRAQNPAFASRGAFGAVTRSIDELAAHARAVEAQLTAGETIVDLDPDLVDASFVADRLGYDDDDFRGLVTAIKTRGQDSPILVRRHPESAGRFQVAFGHRRLRAAKELGRMVRAVVKTLSDCDLLLAQGQENSARANLSFIERALFAHRLEQAGHERDMIMSALSVDKTVVSRMISVASKIPSPIIEAIGPAPDAGRSRWVELASAFDTSEQPPIASLLVSPLFLEADTNARFELLHAAVAGDMSPEATHANPKASKRGRGDTLAWSSAEGRKIARAANNARAFTLFIDNHEAPGFGDFLLTQMDRLYADYSAQRKEG